MCDMTLLRSLLEGTCLSSGPEGTEEANEGEESHGTNEFMGLLSANSCASMSYPFSTVWDSVQLLMFSSYTLHGLAASTLSRVTKWSLSSCQNGLGLVIECFPWFKQLMEFFSSLCYKLVFKDKHTRDAFYSPFARCKYFFPQTVRYYIFKYFIFRPVVVPYWNYREVPKLCFMR